MKLIETIGLSKCYNEDSPASHRIYAVSDVNLTILKGETLGLVGESGCGKSTLSRMILRLEKITSGQVLFKGEDITGYRYGHMRRLRKDIQIIFQNSGSSFNPHFTVEQIITEPLANYKKMSRTAYREQVVQVLEKVGLDEEYAFRYPSQLSGGQRQRVGIARALVLNPEFVVCDEPVSSLDFTIRGQVLRLLGNLKSQLGLTYLFISHDLSAVKRMCDRIAVMYMGSIVEVIPREAVESGKARHPYTVALLSAALTTDPRKRREKKVLLKGELERGTASDGCLFNNRCLYAEPVCKTAKPALKFVDDHHQVACHLFRGMQGKGCRLQGPDPSAGQSA
ncbi:MAG: ABC transporter ATP-binding protein [Clostridiales bacterium]|jgi:peptide/nickel transport system ATP-binding protein/oligopeptide transport system ATP-binding protein|nr:ABC transporter ATP-binding protein [Eubacteriales bacterium]MDH7566211.1 ABC transporter ATP-binding protein [Clostridiales bacterium]